MTTDSTMAKEQLSAEFRDVLRDIEALMSTTAGLAESEAAALRERINERLETVKARVNSAQQEAAHQAQRAAGAADSYVHEHPWQAVGIAGALGVVIGMLIGRR